MLLDDFIDVFLIHIRVPDIFRIDHDDRALIATVEASRIIDPYPPGLAVQPEGLDARFSIVPHGLGSVIITADGARLPLIYAEKYMALIVAHKQYGRNYWIGLKKGE
jgi:hypothetical protein